MRLYAVKMEEKENILKSYYNKQFVPNNSTL